MIKFLGVVLSITIILYLPHFGPYCLPSDSILTVLVFYPDFLHLDYYFLVNFLILLLPLLPRIHHSIHTQYLQPPLVFHSIIITIQQNCLQMQALPTVLCSIFVSQEEPLQGVISRHSNNFWLVAIIKHFLLF